MEHMPLSLKVDRIIDHAEMPKSGDQTAIQKLTDEDEFKDVYLTGFPMDSANTFQVTGSNIGWGKLQELECNSDRDGDDYDHSHSDECH